MAVPWGVKKETSYSEPLMKITKHHLWAETESRASNPGAVLRLFKARGRKGDIDTEESTLSFTNYMFQIDD